nr:hypothetical protein [Marseillevirus cajuinensis]
MEKLEDWPYEWKKILLCTEHWNYGGNCSAEHRTTPVLGLSGLTHEWVSCEFNLGVCRLEIFVPHAIYETPSGDIVCQIIEGGRWFVFSGGNIDDWCSTCDGKTESSCTVTECVSLYDLVWWGIGETDRRFCAKMCCDFETFQDFKKSVTKTQLKKKLFR